MMKKPTLSVIIAGALCAGATQAQISTSSSYELLSAETGPGGGAVQNTGGTVTAEISVGDGVAGGVSSATASGVQLKGNFTGQLYDPVALEIVATPDTINESGTSQLSGTARLDDDTTLSLASTDILWSIVSGPFINISGSGLATADVVYQNESAQVKGAWRGFEDFENISVLNFGRDDFGSYAGDGIDDDWQVLYFGLDNPLAGPGMNPDKDDQDNLFEFIAGVDPTDPLSFFDMRLEPVPGEPAHRRVVFNPFFLNRTYVLTNSTTLTPGSHAPVPSTTSSNSGDGSEGTITDTDATETRKFYKIEISRNLAP